MVRGHSLPSTKTVTNEGRVCKTPRLLARVNLIHIDSSRKMVRGYPLASAKMVTTEGSVCKSPRVLARVNLTRTDSSRKDGSRTLAGIRQNRNNRKGEFTNLCEG